MLIYQLMPTANEIKGGHVSNHILPLWFDKARTDFVRTATSYAPTNSSFGVVRHASYDYRLQILPEAEVTIKTGISNIASSSVTCYQEAWQFDQLTVSAEVILVLIDQSKVCKISLSEAVRAYLSKLLLN